LSAGRGASARVAGIGDAHEAAFRDVMREVATSLLPPQNRQEQDHDSCAPPGDC